jgi:hypothetical protein
VTLYRRAGDWTRFAGFAASLLLYACGGGAPQPAVTVRDSAGVRIVESRAPTWRAGEGWRLARAPALTIGVAQGDPNYELEQVTGVVRLGDGRIVVADGGSGELRFYDKRGRFLLAAGREGEGPGEFRRIRLLELSRDSLWVYDQQLLRASVFNTAGHFVRSVPLNNFSGFVGQFADGSFLVARLHMPENSTKQGVHTWLATYYRLSPSGQVVDSLGVFPQDQEYLTLSPDGGFETARYLFGRVSAAAVGAARLFFGSAATYRIEVYGQDGRLETVMRQSLRTSPVTPDDVDSVVQVVARRVREPDRRRRVEVAYRKLRHAPTKPAYSDFRVDALGDLWVGGYEPLRRAAPRWAVFDPNGRLLGVVAVPSDFAVYQIGADYVLGTRADSLGVERVELYPLLKPKP